MKKFVLVLLIMLAGITTQAQEKKNKNAKADIAVKGNCDQCKKRIEKAAYSVKGVKTAAWSEETNNLHLILDETKCTANDVQTAVAKAGHDTENLKATDDDYNGLHHCCQYDRS
jgi:mercuric ion binding protein